MASQPISLPATLSPAQMKVVAALAQGASVAEAARAAGVHRSTVYTWLESEPDFVTAVQESRAEFAQYLRAELRQLTTLALATLRQLLENADTPPALKLRAANAVLQAGVRYQVTEHPPRGYLLEDWYFAELGLKAEAKAAPPEAGAARPESGAAVEPLRVARGAVGRNSPCPCGSGQKYKRCCGKNAPPLLHAA
jgi:AcrR family transcriptional regulator